MAQTPTAAWERAFSKAEPNPDILATITVDPVVPTTFVMVSHPESQLDKARLINSITPIGPAFDPLTFKNETKAEFNVGLAEVTLTRKLIANNKLRGRKIVLLLGEIDLTGEADYLDMVAGLIEDVEVEEGIINLLCRGAWAVARRQLFSKVNGWHGEHPYAIMKEVLDAGLDASFINATSLDSDDSANDKVGHFALSRAVHGPYDRRLGNNSDGHKLLDELSQITQTALIPLEDGRMTAKFYDPTVASVHEFTGDDIVPGSWEQGSLYENLKTRVTVLFGWKAGTGSGLVVSGSREVGTLERIEPQQGGEKSDDYAYQFKTNNTTSQTDRAHASSGPGSNRIIEHTLEDRWMGVKAALVDAISVGAGEGDTFTVAGWFAHGFTGARTDGVNATRDVTPAKLAVVRIGRELISCKAGVKVNLETQEHPTPPETGDEPQGYDFSGIGGTGLALFAIQYTIKARGVNATPVVAHAVDDVVVDFTLPERYARQTLERFTNGCPFVRFDTPLRVMRPQAGDFATIVYDRFLGEGQDGIGSGTKWQITRKEIDIDAGVIHWGLAQALTALLAITVGDLLKFPARWNLTEQLIDRVTNADALLSWVSDGLTVTGIGGLTATIARGHASLSGSRGMRANLSADLAVTLLANRDYFVYFDPEAHAIVWFPVATGAAEPTAKPGNYLLLSKVVVGGTQIDTIADRRKTLGIRGPVVRGFPGPTKTTLPDPADFDPGQLFQIGDEIRRRWENTYDDLVLDTASGAEALFYLKLDETSGTTAVDASSNGNDFTYLNTPNLAQAALINDGGNSVEFRNGVQNEAAQASFSETGVTQASFEAWIDVAATTARQVVMDARAPGVPNTQQFSLEFLAGINGALAFFINNVQTISAKLLKADFMDSGPVLIGITWDSSGGAVEIIRNGTFGESFTGKNSGGTIAINTNWTIGALQSLLFNLDGKIDAAAGWTGRIITAAEQLARVRRSIQENTNFEQVSSLEGLDLKFAFAAFLNTSQSVSSGAIDLVKFDRALFNPGGGFDPSSFGFRAPSKGRYVFLSFIEWVTMTAGKPTRAELRVQGVTKQFGVRVTSADTAIGCSVMGVLDLAANSGVSVFVQNGDSVTRTIQSGSTRTTFMGFRISA